MRLHRWGAVCALLLATSAVTSACEGPRSQGADTKTSESGAALSLQVPEDADVAAFKIIVQRVSCAGEAVPPEAPVVLTSALLDLDLSVKVTADGSSHPFADTFVPLVAGCYDVLSQPLQADGSPSKDCAIAGANNVVIADGLPTEIVLVSQCGGQVEVGATDMIVTLNRPPQLLGTEYPGGKFVAHCDAQQICATFKDPDSDPIQIEWTQVGGIPLVSLTPLPPTPGPDGSITQCVEIEHGGQGMVLLEAKAFDLMKDPNGPGLIPFEQFYAQNGIPATSHDAMLLQGYGASSAACPCEPNAEVCDGVDNDCDGDNDEGLPDCVCTPLAQTPCYEGASTTKGVGQCKPGVQVCDVDGSALGPCQGQVLPAPEVCPGGADEDCNGAVDDCCVAGEGGPCAVPGGFGPCATGVLLCDGSCLAPDPGVESCNGVDDDCDGLTDDGDFGSMPCSAGQGACQGSGVFTCVGGQLACNALAGMPTAEICNNGIDEDCDGVTDDCPPCAANAGAPCQVPGQVGTCAAGQVDCAGACAPKNLAVPETCNGADDDCDGQFDEGVFGPCSAGVGACQSSGQFVCSGGGLVCNAVPGAPGAEIACNGVDENCDGNPNDGCVNCSPAMGTPCTDATKNGACQSGQINCAGVCASIVQPSPEQCNLLDDDCDASVDEGLSQGPCSAGLGACQASGQIVCVAGAFACNAMPGQPVAEVCNNGVDENCNGVADDGAGCNPACVPNAGTACVDSTKIGPCQTGLVACNGTCTSNVPPVAETCNQIDDDCDGQTDEGLTGTACQAGIGACLATGQEVCQNGTFTCNAVAGTPQTEISCNNVDEDCNGADLCVPCNPCDPQYDPFTTTLACGSSSCTLNGDGTGTWTIGVDASLPGTFFTCQQEIVYLTEVVSCSGPVDPDPPFCNACQLCDVTYENGPNGHCLTKCHALPNGTATCSYFYMDPTGSTCQVITPGSVAEEEVDCNDP